MVLGAGSASAAYVEAKVPFDFVVRGKTMPAGDYIVEHNDNEPSVLVIRGRDGAHAAALVLTEPARSQDPAGWRPSLRFKREGSQYYLEDVWPSKNEGWEIEIKTERR